MRSMLRRWPPRAEPVRTRVFRPARADVSPAVSPATPPPAITTSYSWFDTQPDPSWFACGPVYHAAKPALSRTSQHSRPTNELCPYTPSVLSSCHTVPHDCSALAKTERVM